MPSATDTKHPSLLQTYEERASLPGTSPLAAYFLKLIAAKRSNLCVSADVTTSKELLQVAEEIGDQICLLKTHADIIHDFGHKTAQDLQAISRRKGFLIFEDRKFGDIGNTVQLQYTAGPLQIVRWANIVNAHVFPGPAIIHALAEAAEDAVAAYNTSVETQISGPPAVTPLLGADEADTPNASAAASTDGRDGDCLSSEDEDFSDDDAAAHSEDDGIGELNSPLGRRLSQNDGDRKFSVVSVSTTISTKTEQISPQPTPLHHRGLSFGPPDVDGAENTDIRKAVQALGDPPMARSLLLLAQMSSSDNLMDDAYAAKCLEWARQVPGFVIGFIAQSCLNRERQDNFITMTPGVQIGSKGDKLGQNYNTPEYVVSERGADVVIVGRGVYAAQDRRAAAEEYRKRAWQAYQERVGTEW